MGFVILAILFVLALALVFFTRGRRGDLDAAAPILRRVGLVAADRAPQVRAAIFRNTSTIGLREQRLEKRALDRELVTVEVAGQPVAVKLARHDGVLVNAQPEYDDVARAAQTLGRPVSDVLADAVAASRRFFAED